MTQTHEKTLKRLISLVIAASLALAVGCGDVPVSSELQGDWQLTQAAGSNDCGDSGSRTVTLSVTESGYVIEVPGTDRKSSETGNPDGNNLKFTITYVLQSGAEITERFDLTANGGSMTGSSSYTQKVEGGATCNGATTIEGTRVGGSSNSPASEDPQPSESLCSDGCRFAGDGVCDDGGANAEYEDCAYGTDCSDCGSR